MIINEVNKKLEGYFHNRMQQFGASPKGVDYNGPDAQEIRFDQLTKIITSQDKFSIIDHGCGYGALYDYLSSRGYQFDYLGFDLNPEMIETAKKIHVKHRNAQFTQDEKNLVVSDYLIAACVYNIKFDCLSSEWTRYIESDLQKMNKLYTKAFSINFLTSYSDESRKRSDLYYADPCHFFDYCKRNFSRNVALLHDYQIFDFTIIVRK